MSATSLSETAAGIVRVLGSMKPKTFQVVVDGEAIGTIAPNKGGYEGQKAAGSAK